MNEVSEQQEDKFRPGVRGWLVMFVVGLICAVLLPIVPLVATATACGMGLGPMCFLVDHSQWVAGVTAAVALIGAMYVTYKVEQRSHRKRSEEQPLRPEMTIHQRQHEARMAWLNDHGRHRR